MVTLLTSAQKATLRNFILADPTMGPQAQAQDFASIKNELNANAAPDFWVWRTSVSRADIYNTVDWEGNSWNWTTYKNQSVTEQGAWTQIFMGDIANFAQDNVRAGVAAIFTGSAQANAQRDHCLSVGRRKANVTEKLFAAGTGSTASPAAMTFEGVLTEQNVSDIVNGL